MLLTDAVELGRPVSTTFRSWLGVVPVHRIVIAQVGPPVAGAEITTGGLGEFAAGEERARGGSVGGEQAPRSAGAAVVHPVIGKGGVDICVDLVRRAGQRLDREVDQ